MGHSLRTATFFALLLTGAAFATPLEIMVEDAAPPQSMKDGTGHANDIVTAAFTAAGTEIRFVVVPYTRCKASVLAGTAPACFSMSWSPQLRDAVVFSDMPMFSVFPRYYRNSSTPSTIRSQMQIPRGTVVGLVNGYEYPASLERLREQGVVFEYVNTEAMNLRKLAAGRLDFAVINLALTRTEAVAFAEAGVTNVVHAFDSEVMGSYIGFSTRHPQGALARERFNRGHAAILEDGTIGAINDKWARLAE